METKNYKELAAKASLYVVFPVTVWLHHEK
jgi:hypothetical protein